MTYQEKRTTVLLVTSSKVQGVAALGNDLRFWAMTMLSFLIVGVIAQIIISKRYGFVYVDKDDEGNGTLDRSKKKSFYWYKQVIASNGEDLASVKLVIE